MNFFLRSAGVVGGMLLEEDVGDPPFIALAVSEEFGDGEEEESPADEPASGLSGSVDLSEDGEDLGAAGVEVGEPGVGGFAIVFAVPVPLTDEQEVVLKSGGEISAGHDTAGEEVFSHPVGIPGGFKDVGGILVAEEVEEEKSFGVEPGADAAEEFGVVAHVFEHFDGEDAIEESGGAEVVHVGGDDLEVVDSSGGGELFDGGFLERGIGDGGDTAVGIAGGDPEGEGPPAAAEFENILSIAELSAFAGDTEGAFLGLFEIADVFLPVTTTVFAMRAEDFREEFGGEFVVLFVGFFGERGDGAGAHEFDEAFQFFLTSSAVPAFDEPDALGTEATDSGSGKEIGNPASFDEINTELDEGHGETPKEVQQA